ncbi:MAG: hypothetical protein ACR2GY_04950 [Phycisphaerales bacterium]
MTKGACDLRHTRAGGYRVKGHGKKQLAVYVMDSRQNETLYIGVTSDFINADGDTGTMLRKDSFCENAWRCQDSRGVTRSST